MNSPSARELIVANHDLPGPYTIKAIGLTQNAFVERIVGAAQESLTRTEDVRYTVRTTANGINTSVTLELMANDADEVLRVYQALQAVEGLRFLM